MAVALELGVGSEQRELVDSGRGHDKLIRGITIRKSWQAHRISHYFRSDLQHVDVRGQSSPQPRAKVVFQFEPAELVLFANLPETDGGQPELCVALAKDGANILRQGIRGICAEQPDVRVQQVSYFMASQSTSNGASKSGDSLAVPRMQPRKLFDLGSGTTRAKGLPRLRS